MRLVGVRVPGSIVGGGPAFIALDAVSVLVGRNDTGKSRLLGYVATALQNAATGGVGEMPTVYLDLGDSPLRWLDAALDASSHGREDLVWTTTPFLGHSQPERADDW